MRAAVSETAARRESHQERGDASRRDVVQGLVALSTAPLLFANRVAAQVGAEDRREPMAVVIDDLIASNRILSNEGVIDAFGHVSSRHPMRRDHFLMSRARAPALVKPADIMEFDAAGAPINPAKGHPYIERFIHAAIYAARPDVRAVVHDHSPDILPFSVSATPLRSLSHTGGLIGERVPVWDIAEKFGDSTNLLVTNMTIGRDLAARLGPGATLLIRGHGAVIAAPTIRTATFIAINLNLQARLEAEAMKLGAVKFLSSDVVRASAINFDPASHGDAVARTWEYWCARAKVPFHAHGA